METAALMALIQLVRRGASIFNAVREGDRSDSTIESALSIVGELRGAVGNVTDPAPTAAQMVEAMENIAKGSEAFGTVFDNTPKN